MGIPWQRSPTYSRSSSNHRALLEMSLAQSLETLSKFENFEVFVCILSLSLSFSPSLPPSLPLLLPLPLTVSVAPYPLVSYLMFPGEEQVSNIQTMRYSIIHHWFHFGSLSYSKAKNQRYCTMMPTADIFGFDRRSWRNHWQISEFCNIIPFQIRSNQPLYLFVHRALLLLPRYKEG